MNHLHFRAAGVDFHVCLGKSPDCTSLCIPSGQVEGPHHRDQVPLALEIGRTVDDLVDLGVPLKFRNYRRVDLECICEIAGQADVQRDLREK